MRRRHRRVLGHDVVLRLDCMGVPRFCGGGVLRDCLPPVAGGAVQAVSALRLDANSNTPASPDPRCLFSNSYGGRHVGEKGSSNRYHPDSSGFEGANGGNKVS